MEICGEKVILRDLTKEDIEKRLYFNTVIQSGRCGIRHGSMKE